MKSSLVILYHREPYDEIIENGVVRYRPKKSPNGIMPTLKSFFGHVNRGTWVAWKQVTEEQKSTFENRITVEEENNNYSVLRIPLLADQVKHFYHITSKEAFWPILHSFPWQFTDESSDWENFKTINRLFAEAACEEAAEDALIWVHDYNLWLAPHYIRQLKPDAKIAFFHHTPFPSVDIFNILPWREQIVDSLLCCDVVGFHIPRYSENFVNVARSLRPVEVLKREDPPAHMTKTGTALAEPEMISQLGYNGRVVNIDAFPVGTNPEHILGVLARPEAKQRLAAMREEFGDRKLLIAAGRVDYVKGNKEMLLAFERLLERRPDLHGTLNFLVTCVTPAAGMRIYETTQHEIEQLVGRINGRFSELGWTPVLLFTEPLNAIDLMCYYKLADVCWTTPLRDGLNLVAKEYVVAHKEDTGVLLLSEFVGAAVELPEALLTNPYSQEKMDESIELALAMPEAEQRERLAKMYATVTTYDVKYWGDRILKIFKTLQADAEKVPQGVA
ncbi:glucosylglycerol-phosphate synthase [Spirulina major]|uniref:glucosylglycerol-phosphate synthase n=1 Tax=Spirulina major TaxID=270636 RepID=UPI000932D88B|nr:glucosylglycerol-phosphate synthase [Spirulina major]